MTKKSIDKTSKIDPRQDLFARLYMMPKINGKHNSYFGNAYQSAIEAGYNESYALRIATPNEGTKWIREAYAKHTKLTGEHIVKGIEDIALDPEEYTRDRLKSYDMLAKIKGMYIERVQNEVTVTFTNSVPRPVIDIVDVSSQNNTVAP